MSALTERVLARLPRPSRPGRPFVLVALAVLAAVWLAGGALGLAVALVAVAGLLLGVHPRAVLAVGVVLMALTPLAWVLGNRSRIGDLGFDLVTANPAPNRFAVAALTLLVVGVFLDEPAPHPREDPHA